jgi:type IX secretion system PorP/SprF family membrane protein
MTSFKTYFLFQISVLLSGALFGQDLEFSQFYSVPVYLSPSFAGSSGGQRISANYRNQWPEIPNAFETYALSYDTWFSKIKSGAGFMLTHDRKGELGIGTTQADLVYSFDFNLSHSIHIRPAVQFQYTFQSVNMEMIRTRLQVLYPGTSANYNISRESSGYVDAGTSVMIYNDVFWTGTTVNHLMRPNYTFGLHDRMPVRFNLYSGVKLLSKGKLMKPRNQNLFLAFDYRQMEKFSQLDIGLMGHKDNFNLGLWYRGIPVLKENPGQDAVIVMIGFSKENYSAGLSYDITISQLKPNTNGAVELSLIFLFPEIAKKKSHSMIPCPGF